MYIPILILILSIILFIKIFSKKSKIHNIEFPIIELPSIQFEERFIQQNLFDLSENHNFRIKRIFIQ